MPRDPRFSALDWSRRLAEQQERLRTLDRNLDWRTWIRRRLAVYWYGLLAVFLDIAIVATVFQSFPRPAGLAPYAASLAFVAPAIYLEWELYRILWPPDEALLEVKERKAFPATRTRSTVPDEPARASEGNPTDSTTESPERPPPET